MMTDRAKRRQAIAARLRDPDYRKAFVEAFAVTNIGVRVRAMRRQRGWTQTDLARRCGRSTSWISQAERADGARLSVRVVARLAAAFDVAALVQFASFGDLLDAFCAKRAEIPAFADDPRINGACARGKAGE